MADTQEELKPRRWYQAPLLWFNIFCWGFIAAEVLSGTRVIPHTVAILVIIAGSVWLCILSKKFIIGGPE